MNQRPAESSAASARGPGDGALVAPCGGDLDEVRGRVVDFCLWLATLIGPLPLLALAWRVAEQEASQPRFPVAADFAAYAAVAVVTLMRRRVPYQLRAGLLVALCYVIGLTDLLAWGLDGTGVAWLLVAAIFGAVISGARVGFALLAVSTATLGAYGAGNVLGVVGADLDAVDNHASAGVWATLVLTVPLIGGGLIGAVTLLFRAVGDANRALLRNEAVLRGITESSTNAIFAAHAATGAIRYVNAAVTRVMGYTPEQALALRAPDFYVDPADRQRLVDMVRADGGASDILVRLKRADGTAMRALVNSRQVDIEGEAYVVSEVADLTERDRYEQAVRLSEQRLRDAIDSIPDGFVLWDVDDRLVLCNDAYRETLPALDHMIEPGLKYDDLLKAAVEQGQFRIDGDPEEWAAGRRARRRTDQAAKEYVLADGRWILAADRPTSDGGSVGLRVDITERKNAEQALRAAKDEAELANRAKAEFLANMSHELRTPLNAILGFSDAMRHGVLGPRCHDPCRHYIDDIHRSGELLLDIINDILDVSAVESGRVALHEEPVDLAPVIDAARRLVAPRAADGEVALDPFVAPDRPPRVLADERRLKQVLVNLLSNAVKFTPEGGSVAVEVESRDDGGLAVSIRDTGVGMTEDEVRTAMEPFRQVDGTLARRREGTGLGLPLVKGLVALHGGSLEIDSRPGEGTRATVIFPPERVLPAA
jgi:PAS domain S-box-containing protein